jgi:trehalose synthase
MGQTAPARLTRVDVGEFDLDRFERVITPEQYRALLDAVAEARRILAGRVIWNVNSTAKGGGVAEMLQSLIAYVRGAGLDARWLVIPGSPEFFRVTKRIHNFLHGSTGDGGRLDEEARRIYEQVLQPSGEALAAEVSPGDVVLLHDPQTAGLTEAVRKAGAFVVWRCHVGLDRPDDIARTAWRFLSPYLANVDAYVFSRSEFAWEGLERSRIWIIPPSIDAFSPKNSELAAPQVDSILTAAGVLAGEAPTPARFQRLDGSEASIVHRAVMFEAKPAGLDDRLVVQVSRWDRLKDPLGVIEAFVTHVDHSTNAQLVLAGPEPASVTDDPEGADVLRSCVARWESLAPEARKQIHLALLPMADAEENAVIVNALQRWSSIVVQKSLAEGFGLTVAEAMWKARPVVASRVGGIQDQIVGEENGVLVGPRDLAGFGAAVSRLLDDRREAGRMGAAAQARVREQFLGVRHLTEYVDLLARVMHDAAVQEAMR